MNGLGKEIVMGMGAEPFYQRSKYLRKLQIGPLRELMDGFSDWLVEQGFKIDRILMHLYNLYHLSEYFDRHNLDRIQSIRSKDIDDFFKEYPSWCKPRCRLENHLRYVSFSINRFVAYLAEKKLFISQSKSELYEPILDEYLGWMAHCRHSAAGTIKVRSRSITHFLKFLGQNATPQGLAGLDRDDVEEFFLSWAEGIGRSVRRSMQSALRTFLRFCLYRGYILKPLDLAVPTLRTYKLAGLPRGLTDAQAKKILHSIDRNTKTGRRDYAIIQLLYTYGIRGCQICGLFLEDIDWAQDKIFFKAAKNGKDALLPMTRKVGVSLLDYLQNSRPSSSYSHVFLTAHAPCQPFPRSSTLSAIIERRIRRADIEVAKKGSHGFRHLFAARMVQKGRSLKAVADVLGHRSLESTFIYTKVDFNCLKQVALEWPGEA
jgi:site-specific recombinase XerD